ncbi:Pyruvate formate-lyase 1-activating enzyme [bioreactor metagenome]|uniref:Pyruvate formate-lyase 1-activating enzyme n=1 Tax=bioreactor metagenome TaxID=1076179 RepID=A0A645FTS1_9ZZZZ
MDTSGYAPTNAIHKVLPYSDAVLFSLKAVNNTVHRKLTGKDNNIILANLRLAASLGTVTVRYVVIPGINNSHADIAALGNIINNLPQPVPVELLPYHTLGRSKWDQLGKAYSLTGVPPATEKEVEQVRQWLKDQNIITIH